MDRLHIHQLDFIAAKCLLALHQQRKDMLSLTPIMDFNPVKFNYNENYTKVATNNFGRVTIEPMKGSDVPVRRLVLPCAEGAEYFASRIVDIKKLETGWREVYHVKLDKVFAFKPGDSIGLLCPNSNVIVDEIMEILGIDDFSCRIERTNGIIFTYVGMVKDFFKHYFDFTSLPKKSLLAKLGKSCGETDQRYIEYLCSREGTKDYLRMGTRWNNIIDFIKTFGCKPTLEDLLGDCEIIKPRYFSLVNRVGESSEILVGIMSKKLNGLLRYGHVSKYLIDSKSEEIQVCLKANLLFQMDVTEKRILGICTGTGIAPFLSFISNMQQDQSIWLLYGFRSDEDDISKMAVLDERVRITKIKSSDGVYVTDYIKANITTIREYLCDECPAYVCGRMEMQREVFKLFKNELEDVVESKRLIFDLWS